MRQQKFNELLIEALEDVAIKNKLKQLLNEKVPMSFEESIRNAEKISERAEREMQERAEVLNDLKASSEPAASQKDQQLQAVEQQNSHLKQQLAQVTAQLHMAEGEKAQQAVRLQQAQQEARSYQQQLSETQIQHKQLTAQMQQQKQQVIQQTAELNTLKQQFTGVRQAYRLYNELSVMTKQRLAGIVKGTSIETFLYCGVQYENIEPLWEAIKREVMEGRTAELGTLDAIFTFFLNAHNELYTQPLLKREVVAVGELLDEDVHMRAANSQVSGAIQQVYFAGYSNVKTSKRVKKSIVGV